MTYTPKTNRPARRVEHKPSLSFTRRTRCRPRSSVPAGAPFPTAAETPQPQDWNIGDIEARAAALRAATFADLNRAAAGAFLTEVGRFLSSRRRRQNRGQDADAPVRGRGPISPL